MNLTLKEIEKQAISKRLVLCDNSRELTAKSLGISVSGLDNKIKRHEIAVQRRRRGGSIEKWIEEIRGLEIKSNREWMQKDRSSYNYMATKGMIGMIAAALGLEMIRAGRPKKVKAGETNDIKVEEGAEV